MNEGLGRHLGTSDPERGMQSTCLAITCQLEGIWCSDSTQCTHFYTEGSILSSFLAIMTCNLAGLVVTGVVICSYNGPRPHLPGLVELHLI
jgi:hypothetical protein